MDRKLCVFFLAVMALLLVVSFAMAEDNFVGVLVVDEEAPFSEPDPHEDYAGDLAEESHFGYNYFAKYRVPKESQLKLYVVEAAKAEDYEEAGIELKGFKVSWDFVPDNDFLKLKEITSDASSDIWTVVGYFPDSADAYTCKFQVMATVVSVNDSEWANDVIGTKNSFDKELEVTIGADTDHIVPVSGDLAKYVIYDSKDVNLNEVDSAYKVTVTVSADYSRIGYYKHYIQSDDEYRVNLPEWLTCEITGEQRSFPNEEIASKFEDTKAITSIVIKFNDKYEGKLLGELEDGTRARVNIPFLSEDDGDFDSGILLSWDVVYKAPDPFAITSAKTLTFNLAPGSKDVATAEYSGSVPESFTSKDVASDVKFTVSSTDIDSLTGKGKITVNIEAAGSAKDGVYENVFTFLDARGKSDDLTIKVTVKKPEEPTPPTPPAKTMAITGTSSLSIKAGESAKTTLTATGNVSGKVTWSAGSVTPAADIVVSSQSLSDTSAMFSAVVGKNVAAGKYNVEVKASDTAGTSASTTMTITVTQDTKQEDDSPQEDTPQDTPQDNPQEEPKENTDAQNLTNRIKITNEAGTSVESMPLSSLSAGAKAVYVISLEGTGITAKAWRLLINGVEVDASSLPAGESVSSSASSWAKIVTSDATSATIEVEPPANLSVDSLVSLSVTGTDDKEYTVDLGTVEKAESGMTSGVGSSSGGCSAGFETLAVLAAFCFLTGRKHS